ncbi:hypothetical protein KGF57_004330, partial [Candida theae]
MIYILLLAVSFIHSFVSATATTTTITVPDNIIEEATIKWCPAHDPRPTEDDEVIYITYYRTTTVYWTSWTTVTKCSNDVCSQVATLTTGTGQPPAASDVVDRTTTYTVFSTTTNYYTDWNIIEYCSSTVDSPSTSVLDESIKPTSAPAITSAVEVITGPVTTTSSSSSDVDDDVTFVTVYQTTTSPWTTCTTLTSCSDNRCSLVTSRTVDGDPSESAMESSSTESSVTEEIKEVSSSLEESVTTSSEALISESSSEVPLATTTEIGTTTITVTSCSNKLCSEVKTVTGVITVTDDTTIYTTFCPLTTFEENLPSESSSTFDFISGYPSTTSSRKSPSVFSSELPHSISSTSDFVESSSDVIITKEDSSTYSSSEGYSISLANPSSESIVESTFDSTTQNYSTNEYNLVSESDRTTKSPLTSELSSPECSTSIPPPVGSTLMLPLSTATSIETTVVTLSTCSNDICSEASRTVVLSTLITGTTIYGCSSSAIELESSTSLAAEASSASIESSTSAIESSSSTEASSANIESSSSIVESSSSIVESSSSIESSSSTYTSIASVTSTSTESSSTPVYSTTSEIHTTIITVTSCKDNSCSKVTQTTGLTTVTEDTTVYTTYCPLTSEFESSTSLAAEASS